MNITPAQAKLILSKMEYRAKRHALMEQAKYLEGELTFDQLTETTKLVHSLNEHIYKSENQQ